MQKQIINYQVATSDHGLTVLQVSCEGKQTIEIVLSDFLKDLTHAATLYDQVNQYLGELSESTQNHVFDVFSKLYQTEQPVDFDSQETVEALESRIAHVTSLLNYENFKVWLRHRSDKIIYPDNILHDYVYDPDMNTTQEKTYIKSEYTDLIAYIIFIRILTPLFLDYYTHVKQVTQHYHYKIFMLFARSELYECPEATKLRTYIDVNQKTLIGSGKNENLILTAGLSDDDILDSMMSEVLFSKILPIDFFHKKCNIISYVFQTIRFKGNFASPDGLSIKSRDSRETSGSSGQEDMSTFENYRKTSDMPIGTVMEIQNALSSVRHLLIGLGRPDFDLTDYHEEIRGIGKYIDCELQDTQMYMLGWFLGKIINPRALFYIEHRKLIELAIFARTVLIAEGHPFIALFLTSKKTSNHNYMSVVIRNSVNRGVVEGLSQNYGFVQEEGRASVVEKTISEAAKEISNSIWTPISPPAHLKDLINSLGYLISPPNVNELVFKFVQYVNSGRPT